MGEKIRTLLQDYSTLQVDSDGAPLSDRAKVATAVLLLAAARADDHFSIDEAHTVFRVIAREFETSDEETSHLLQIAEFLSKQPGKVEELSETLITSYNHPQRVYMLSMVLRVVRADGTISKSEADRVKQVMELFQLSEEDLLTANQLIPAQ